MRKRFIKFQVSRVISSFKSCRSKDPSTLPANPVPSLFLRHKLNHPPPQPPPQPPKRHVWGGVWRPRASSRSFPEVAHTKSSSLSHFSWRKEDNYDSTPPRPKIYNSAVSDTDTDTEHQNDIVLFPPLPTRLPRRRVRRHRKPVRISTSSDSGLFSENEETETLVSTDSDRKRKPRRPPENMPSPVPARLSEFMRAMVPCTTVEGKVRESFAVVKRSEDPYEDFKRSMVEMVVEKKMFEERELEELLRCFLSLNSVDHHGVIVRAFVDIWEALFCHSPLPEKLTARLI